MMRILRTLIALAREAWAEGMWVHAPPLVLPGFSPVWRAAPPPRIEVVADNPGPVASATRTDPRLVAARRARFRLILNPSKA